MTDNERYDAIAAINRRYPEPRTAEQEVKRQAELRQLGPWPLSFVRVR
ncbi:MAG: hypothetical protein AAF918_16960 [Pseudomonadota bacterium]